MARVAGQIAARGASTWRDPLLYLGRDPHTGARKYDIQVPFHMVRFAKRSSFLNRQASSNGITAACRARLFRVRYHLFGQWLSTGDQKARVRARTFRDYEMRPRERYLKMRRTLVFR